MSTIILGVGNPILGDDAAGILAVNQLQDLSQLDTVEVAEAQTGGLPLVEQFLDHRQVILIDSMANQQPGELVVTNLGKLEEKSVTSGVHDMGLLSSFNFLRSVHSTRLPSSNRVEIFGIGIGSQHQFSEEISPQVEQAVDQVVGQVRNKFEVFNKDTDGLN